MFTIVNKALKEKSCTGSGTALYWTKSYSKYIIEQLLF